MLDAGRCLLQTRDFRVVPPIAQLRLEPQQQLIESIQSKLMPLDDSVKAYSGHGPVTSIGMERKHNPFLTGRF